MHVCETYNDMEYIFFFFLCIMIEEIKIHNKRLVFCWRNLSRLSLLFKLDQRKLFLDRAIDMAGGPARGRDKDHTKTTLFGRRRRRRSSYAAILHGVLEKYVPLFVNAVETAKEESPVFDSNEHLAEQEPPHSCYRI